jgi:hypothetical protein
MTFRYEEREFHRRDLRQTADYFALKKLPERSASS